MIQTKQIPSTWNMAGPHNPNQNNNMKKADLQHHLLTAPNLITTKHHPDSLSTLHSRYRSVFTPKMIEALPHQFSSGQFNSYLFFNEKHPRSPYIILNFLCQELSIPGSGVASGSLAAHEPLELLAFYSGSSGWHGCAESLKKLSHRIATNELIPSSKLF
jgi:hypothetical protein